MISRRSTQPQGARLVGAAARRPALGVMPAALRRHGLLIGIVLAGVLLRLWFIAVSPLNPAFSSADDGDYYRRALRLATTGVYLDDFWLIRPPGATLFFAGWLRLALALGIPEYGWRVIQLAQVGLGVLTALLGYDLARRLFGRRAGLIFAALLSLWYPFVELSSVLFTELLYTFLFTLYLWLLARFDAGNRGEGREERGYSLLGWIFGAGLVLGISALVRSPALYSVVFVYLWLLVERWLAGVRVNRSYLSSLLRAVRQILLPAIVFTTGMLLIVGPWTLRNYLVYERIIPVDTLGPINLWLDFGSPDERNPKIQELLTLPQADRQAYASARLAEELDGRPWLLFKDAWENFRHVWKAQFVEDFFVKSSFFTRPLRETWPLGIAGDLFWLVFVVAGLAALAAPPREHWHWRLLVLAWLAYSMLTIFLFHVEPRYLLPIWFLVGLYGAWGLAGPRALLAELRRVPPTGALALALVVGALYLILSYRDYPAMIASGLARERAMAAGEHAYLAGDYVDAEQAFRRALEAQPWQNDTRASLALALTGQGRREEAWELVGSGGPRRTNLVAAHLARSLGREKTARTLFDLVEYTAGEDIQVYAMRWLPGEPLRRLRLGDNMDIGYIAGFAHGEQGSGFSFRWLEGQGRISLPLAEPLRAGSALELRMSGGLPGATPLTVRFSDGTTAVVPVRQGEWRVYRLEVPAALDGQGRLDVELRAPTFVPARTSPGSDDTRTLSLMLSDVAVD